MNYDGEGVDLKKIDECIGDTEADVSNPILDYQQDAQVQLFGFILFSFEYLIVGKEIKVI